MDETVIARRKPGNRQARPVGEQWLFGGIDVMTKYVLFFNPNTYFCVNRPEFETAFIFFFLIQRLYSLYNNISYH